MLMFDVTLECLNVDYWAQKIQEVADVSLLLDL
jgi:hypothetical protein